MGLTDGILGHFNLREKQECILIYVWIYHTSAPFGLETQQDEFHPFWPRKAAYPGNVAGGGTQHSHIWVCWRVAVISQLYSLPGRFRPIRVSYRRNERYKLAKLIYHLSIVLNDSTA